MLRSSSKSSLLSPPFKKKDNQIILDQVQQTLQEASKVMDFQYFQNFFYSVIKQLIVNSEIQKCQHQYLGKLKSIIKNYKPSLQIEARLLLLQIKCQIQSFPSSQTLQKLKKAKHLVIDTDCQYILAKIFIFEAQYYEYDNDINMVYKCHKKCIDFTEKYALQYLKQKEQIRKQIAQYMIISLFQIFQIKKQTSPRQAEELLTKALKACEKNYGYDNALTLQIKQMCSQQKSYKSNFDKISQSSQSNKAITEILDYQMKKSVRIYGYYSWQQEKLVAQMIKIKNQQKKISSQVSYAIKLDMNSINKLKTEEWVQVINGDLMILQEQIIRAAGDPSYKSPKNKQYTAATRIGLKNISREQIIKKQQYSSSQDDSTLFQNGDFNLAKVLGKGSTRGRSQSAHKKINY